MATRRRCLGVLAWAGVSLALGGCSRGAPREPGPMRVVVSIAPLKGLVEPLLPRDAAVTILVPPGRSEHGWEPSPGDLRTLANADLLVTVGLGLDAGAERAARALKSARREDVSFAAVVGLEGTSDEHAGHDHAPGEESAGANEAAHDHHGLDPHLWLDPVLCRTFVKGLAPRVGAACVRAGSGECDRITPRAEEVDARLEALDAEYRRRLEPFKGMAIVTHHAAFERLAERYGLRVVEVIRVVEGMEPTPAQIERVIEAVRREGVRAIFAEPQYADRGVARIAGAAGVALGRLDPIGQGDWFAMMQANLDELVARLGG